MVVDAHTLHGCVPALQPLSHMHGVALDRTTSRCELQRNSQAHTISSDMMNARCNPPQNQHARSRLQTALFVEHPIKVNHIRAVPQTAASCDLHLMHKRAALVPAPPVPAPPVPAPPALWPHSTSQRCSQEVQTQASRLPRVHVAALRHSVRVDG